MASIAGRRINIQARRATRTTDPQAFWKDNVLILNVFADEVAQVTLTRLDEIDCEKEADRKQIPLDKVIKNRQLNKAGAVKFQRLKESGLLPVNPLEVSLHRRDTEPVQPPAGSSGSYLGNIVQSVKKRLTGQDTVEPWVVEAYQLYRIPFPTSGNYHTYLADELRNDFIHYKVSPGVPAVHPKLLLREEDLLGSLDPNSSFNSEKEHLQVTVETAFARKKDLLGKLELIDPVSPRISGYILYTEVPGLAADTSTTSSRSPGGTSIQHLHQSAEEREQNIHREEPQDPTMVTPCPVKVGNVDAVAEELGRIRTRLTEHATNPLDQDDVEHLEDRLKGMDEVMQKDMDSIIAMPRLPEDQLRLFQKQKNTINQEKRELQLELKKIRRKLGITDTPAPQRRASAGHSTRLPLPKAVIPTFRGDWQEWLTFKDVINSLVINNPDGDVPDIQKFLLLQQSLTGPPRDIIKNIPVTGANFARAWQALQDYYHNPQKLKDKYFSLIADVTKLKYPSAPNLRKVYSTLSNAREALVVLEVAGGDEYIISQLVKCFDDETRNYYVMRVRPEGTDDDESPTWKEVTSFINKRCIALENSHFSARDERPSTFRKSTVLAAQWKDTNGDRPPPPPRAWFCPMCPDSHGIWNFKKFKAKSVEQRRNFIKEKRLCFNCFSPRHGIKDCRSRFNCKICHSKHHSLLHVADRRQPTSNSNQEGGGVQANTAECFNQVILPTARVWVTDASKELFPFRALLDTGSQTNFISEKAVQYLRLKRRHTSIQITGIGNGNAPKPKGAVTLQIQSIVDSSVKMTVMAIILPQVTGDTPSIKSPFQRWPHLKGLDLADPDFGKPGKVDILLGADVVFQCLTGQRMAGQSKEPVAHSTTFGWIIGGSSASLTSPNKVSVNFAVQNIVPLAVLQQFWGAEGLSEEQMPMYQKKEDKICEEMFMSTTTRLEDGKLQVCMPFKNDPPVLGASKDIALKRLAGTEAKLARNADLRRQYEEFMDDYERQNHMEEVKVSTDKDVYLPHHPIIRTTTLTTKLRVVFDASAKTSNAKSLNDEQLVGPVIQDDLFTILARFRLHRIAINGDIAKMYRQIWIAPEQQDYQRILWRRKPTDPVSTFRLKTVTYGTASAPWLATRALKWIADNEEQKNSEASRIIREDFYMDDLLSGSDSPEEAHKIQNEVTSILLSYGLPLRKWASNDDWVIRGINGDQEMMTNPEDIIKTLGLKWNAKEDAFQFKVKLKEFSSLTKREMISEIACTFDPLGFAAPVIVIAKILYQQVWTTKTDWDDPLPEDIATSYQSFRQQLSKLEAISLPRWVGSLSTHKLELHGFSDASEKAYGAAVYVRIINPSGTVSNLVAAKTRVAPLSTVSLPRLELMGAVLLAELMKKLVVAYRRTVESLYYWTDSTITLAWIQSQPGRFKTFVANRISAIQELSKKEDWRHVGTKDNPADLASRGIMPEELTGTIKQMWFQGPNWLREGNLPPTKIVPEVQDELKKIKVLHAVTSVNPIVELIERSSSFPRLWRTMAWICRFAYNCRHQDKKLSSQLSPAEQEEAFLRLSHAVQYQEWTKEVKAFVRGTSPEEDHNPVIEVMKKSKINNLNPFRGYLNVLRVGGRLRSCDKEFEVNHPVILPYGHFAQIYLKELHVKTLHAGPTLMIATARQKVWIIRGLQLAKEVVKKCITCRRWKGQTMNQQMGNLPQARTEGLRAFNIVGVDYAGPMTIKTRKGRGASTSKTWICVFVCFATKAIHLELVSELTTEGFIAAFRRFVARRGLPKEIHSDNGTNFVGADKELKKLLQQQTFQQDILSNALNEGITWKFIPPSAPHQGGLWEAAVKSVKHHLRRTLGASMLTFEEFATVLCQIEAQLNSRPLCPLTEDPSDLNVLTPGHFLVGQPLTTAPDPNLAEIKENRLGRFQYLQRLQQEFWAKWHLEYLSIMQKRNKWKDPEEDIKLDALVLIKEDNIAPLQWRRGRVIALHPGNDGKTRVVTLKTAQGEVSRPIVKLVKLY